MNAGDTKRQPPRVITRKCNGCGRETPLNGLRDDTCIDCLKMDTDRLNWLEQTRTPCLPFHDPQKWICGQVGKVPIGMTDTIREAIDTAMGITL